MSHTITSRNPARNYAVLGSVDASSKQDIRTAVAAARSASQEWKDTDVTMRVKIVRRLWESCLDRAQEIAELITREIGTPVSECLDEILWNKEYAEWFLDHAAEAVSPVITGSDEAAVHTVLYEPIGTAAVITPWNLPFDMFVWGVIPNLLAGNTVVYKAAEECVLTGKLLEDICRHAHLPEGILTFIHGGAKEGKILVEQNIDLIWFTGSSDVGLGLYRLAAKKSIKAILEMGGSNPVIVFEDADLKAACAAILSKRFMFCGQTCDADKRLIVHESVYGKVVDILSDTVRSIVPGDPEKKDTVLGPLVSKNQLEILKLQVEDAREKGATVITGNASESRLKGAFFQPTILTDIRRDMRVWKEEVFGPVLPVVSFKTEAEAITLANDTSYGLGSQIFTKDGKRARRVASRILAGNVDINGIGHFRPFNPFGGYKMSGVGREHGIEGFRELCRVKVVSMPASL